MKTWEVEKFGTLTAFVISMAFVVSLFITPSILLFRAKEKEIEEAEYLIEELAGN